MKIRNILENLEPLAGRQIEDSEPVAHRKSNIDVVTLADLNTLQLRTLKRIAGGAVTVDTASDREFEVMDDLHAMGVLDDEYELSEIGHGLLNAKSEPESLSSSMNDKDTIDADHVDDIAPDDEFEEIEDFTHRFQHR